jgi:hypothetical protein
MLKQRLNEDQGSEQTQSGEELQNLQKELENQLEQEDLKWKQRAKVNWLRHRDHNTKFYHTCANQRHRTNQITKIRDEAGENWESMEDIQTAFINYFSDLYKAGPTGDIDDCIQSMCPKVTEEMNANLVENFTEEVAYALKQMAPLKTPGPDGLPADEVCQAIIDALNSGIMPHFLNMTNIALIPKVKNPTSVTEFRPISLCNVLYKLISKVLANRLKKIMPFIISQNQSAFIPGRLITDNVLAAYETLHTMHTRLSGKHGFMVIKLDMSKAYDRVEWSFLEATMRRMGFASRWIGLIMMCVNTVRYSILVNGNQCGHIIPTRGLRQRDPISPYLFLICAEALSALVTKPNTEGDLLGVPTSKYGPRISHLFFADDSLLFCRSPMTQWHQLTSLLKKYEEASGQRLNCSKTSIFSVKILLKRSERRL